MERIGGILMSISQKYKGGALKFDIHRYSGEVYAYLNDQDSITDPDEVVPEVFTFSKVRGDINFDPNGFNELGNLLKDRLIHEFEERGLEWNEYP